jgi:hypothetical protein
MPNCLERSRSSLERAEWCCLGLALFWAVYGLLAPPQLLLVPVLASGTLSVVGGALGGVATALRSYEDRVRLLERELHRLRARLAVEAAILPAEGAAAADQVFLAAEAVSGSRHQTAGL